MSRDFAELDYRKTPLGELTLRRRRVHALGGVDVFEVKLGDAFLMSSLFHEVEVALARLGLAAESPLAAAYVTTLEAEAKRPGSMLDLLRGAHVV